MGDLHRALADYQAADDIMRVSTTGIEVARTLVALGRFAEAAEVAQQIVQNPKQPNEPPAFAVARDAARILAPIAQKRAATVKFVIDGVPATAAALVTIDGAHAPQGTDASSRLLNPGKHSITISVVGYRASTEQTVREGEQVTVYLSLTPEPVTASCALSVADQLKAERYVWGMVEKKDATVAGTLGYWARDKGSVIVPIEYRATASPEELTQVARASLEKLTDLPPKGRLLVESAQAGTLFVDGSPVSALEAGKATFTIAAGSHKVVLKSPGYLDAEATVTVRPVGNASVKLEPRASEALLSANRRKVAGFVTLGAGVTLAVVGAVSSAEVASAQTVVDEYRQGRPGTYDVCADSKTSANADLKSACARGTVFSTLQFVTFPLAAVAGGVGVFLIVSGYRMSSSPAPVSAWTFSPAIGRSGANFEFSYRF